MFRPIGLIASYVALSAIVLATGCQQTEQAEPSAPPAPTFRGPEFLHGTIGSLASVRGYEPTLVSGYGLLVGLEGTGSGDVPPRLREWMLDEMRRGGFGRHEFNAAHIRPEAFLNSDETTIVLIEGIVPPGATRGTRFDLMISTLPATQATSVRGGTLYTSELSIGGRNFLPSAVDASANARGPVYSSPFATVANLESEDDVEVDEDPRIGRILAGGITLQDMDLELVLTRPNLLSARRIADRINGAFPPDPADPRELAVQQDEAVIELNVLERFKDDPRLMLELILHLDMNPSQDYARQRAVELAELIEDEENARYTDNVVYAWKGMGRPILDNLRELYEHDNRRVRLAALRAGSYLADTRAHEPLMAMLEANPIEPEHAEQAARMLGRLLAHRPDFARVGAFLRSQLDHDLPQVRIAAYQALAHVEHPSVQRWGFPRKMELALAHSGRPMVHIAQSGVPRVIVFGTQLPLEPPVFFSVWDNRFMLRSDSDGDELEIFYQPHGSSAIRTSVPNNLVHLIGVMAYAPDADSTSVGLNMSYSEITYVLHQLHEEGLFDAPLMLQESDFARRVIESRGSEGQQMRPESDPVQEIPGAEGMQDDLRPQILADPDQAEAREEGDHPAEVEGEQGLPPAQFEQLD